MGADIKVDGVAPHRVFDALDDAFPGQYGIGLYEFYVHIDIRKDKARW